MVKFLPWQQAGPRRMQRKGKARPLLSHRNPGSAAPPAGASRVHTHPSARRGPRGLMSAANMSAPTQSTPFLASSLFCFWVGLPASLPLCALPPFCSHHPRALPAFSTRTKPVLCLRPSTGMLISPHFPHLSVPVRAPSIPACSQLSRRAWENAQCWAGRQRSWLIGSDVRVKCAFLASSRDSAGPRTTL